MNKNMNSTRRSYRWYNAQANPASGWFVAGPEDSGGPVSGPGNIVTGRMLGNMLFTRTDTPGTNGMVGSYRNRTLGLQYPTASHEPRYETRLDGGRGLVLEYGQTNKLYGSRNWSTSGAIAWTASQVTGLGTLAATGPDGTTSAVVLTATSSSGHVTQARGSVGLGTRVFAVWMRTPTGSGSKSVDITVNNFSTHTGVTVTETWQRFSITLSSGQATPGIRIHGNGTVIYAYAPMLVLSSLGSDAINDDTDAAFGQEQLNGSFMGLTAGSTTVVDVWKRDFPQITGSQGIFHVYGAHETPLTWGFSLTPVNLEFWLDDGMEYMVNEFLPNPTWPDRMKIAVAIKPGMKRYAFTGASSVGFMEGFLNYPLNGNTTVNYTGTQVLLSSAVTYPFFASDADLLAYTQIS